MPDDPMFDIPDVTPEGTAVPDSAPGTSVSPEVLQEAISGLTGPLEAANESQQHTIDALSAEVAQLRAQANTPAEAPTGEFSEELFNDPEATIRRLSQEVSQENLQQLGPALQTFHQLASVTLYDRYMSDIDKEFGDGTWEEEFRPIIDARLAQERTTNPMVSANPDWMNREVLTVKGLKMSDLMSRQNDTTTKADDAKASERKLLMDELANTTTLTGGINMRPENRPKDATEHESDYLASMQRAGDEVSLEDLRRSLDCGSSYSDWKAAQKPSSKES